jgi:ribosomal-protein-alanine N-acetyltransferase
VDAVVFIDAATHADVDALVTVERRCATHPWTSRHFLDEMDESLRTRVLALRALVPAHATAVVVGFCGYRRVADEVHIENLAVDPDYQGRGFGRLLLRTALGAALRDGARLALLEVRQGNARAQQLYASEGFRETARRTAYYAEPVEDAVVLLRHL